MQPEHHTDRPPLLIGQCRPTTDVGLISEHPPLWTPQRPGSRFVSVKASSIERAAAPCWRTLRHSPASVERCAVSSARTYERPQHSAHERSPRLSRAHRRIVARRHHQRWGYGSRTLEAFTLADGWPGRVEGVSVYPYGPIRE